jgi:hypothetical protein
VAFNSKNYLRSVKKKMVLNSPGINKINLYNLLKINKLVYN